MFRDRFFFSNVIRPGSWFIRNREHGRNLDFSCTLNGRLIKGGFFAYKLEKQTLAKLDKNRIKRNKNTTTNNNKNEPPTPHQPMHKQNKTRAKEEIVRLLRVQRSIRKEAGKLGLGRHRVWRLEAGTIGMFSHCKQSE